MSHKEIDKRKLTCQQLSQIISELSKEEKRLGSQIKLASQSMDKICKSKTEEAQQATIMVFTCYTQLIQERQYILGAMAEAEDLYEKKLNEASKRRKAEREKQEKRARFRRLDKAWYREASDFAKRLKDSLQDRRDHPLMKG